MKVSLTHLKDGRVRVRVSHGATGDNPREVVEDPEAMTRSDVSADICCEAPDVSTAVQMTIMTFADLQRQCVEALTSLGLRIAMEKDPRPVPHGVVS